MQFDNFNSRIFHHCKIVPIFPLLHFHHLHFLVLSCRYFHSRFFHSRILSAPYRTRQFNYLPHRGWISPNFSGHPKCRPPIVHLATILVTISLHCLNCTKFGQLIIMNIFTIVATRCHISRLKCTKFDFGWGSAPDSAGGAHTAPQIL